MNDTDHETDPQRERDVGQGYPEESQPGTGIDPREHAEDDATPDHDAPQSHPGRDSDPSHATGNPRASGG
ncbi:MAG TPA: hypothetical protein VG474_06535 [Solirubrobacteraceae bacterium]|nr:hypothetical protein [Solirubrobacteraceae bacterium]